MQNYHAVVWLDHREAHVYFFDRDSWREVDVASKTAGRHLHHKSGSISGKKSSEDKAYFDAIVTAMAPSQEWLVMGPGSAKTEFAKHVKEHAHQMASRILGVEAADHPSAGQVVAHARDFFHKIDRTRPEVKG